MSERQISIDRVVRGGRARLLIVVVLVLVLVLVLAGCSSYGGTTVEEGGVGGRVQTDGEHCAVTLPEGWTWYPASWTARSPNGTGMSFTEELYGRPMYPDWDEARPQTIEAAEHAGATVTADDDTVRADYGTGGGLSVLQRFDRVGCRLTFSYVGGAREQELDAWEGIVASLERTSPTPDRFTPTS